MLNTDAGTSGAAPLLAFFHACPWPLLLAGADRVIQAANVAAERLLARAAAELVGQSVETLFPVEHPEALADGRWTVMIAHPDGPFPVEVSACAAPTAPGGAAYVLQLHDGREDRLLFEEKVKTAELAGIFRTIATVNHEINNPLFGLMATLQLLRDELGPQSPSVEKKLDRMEQCVERIKQITDDLSQVIRPARRTYAADEKMLDLERARLVPRPPAAPRGEP
ncbi:MAG TPA: histidine kinase dimerization/phospho-acceptor domain-containing protein [Armatimonadota bacterium]|nr:histidine kinase dimerization/phospho-acceptor domain-containing protein [Armatimonadota bacterium]